MTPEDLLTIELAQASCHVYKRSRYESRLIEALRDAWHDLAEFKAGRATLTHDQWKWTGRDGKLRKART